MTTIKQQRLTLYHPIENTKGVIIKICSLDKYTMEESNNLSSTYKILVYEGFNTCVIDNHLIRIDENKTECFIGINNIDGGTLSREDLTRLQNNYLRLLTNILDGKSIIKKRQPITYHEKSISPKIVLVLALIVIAVVILILGKMFGFD